MLAVHDDVAEWSSWNKRSDPVLHIELRKWADIFVIAPLDANTMAKVFYSLIADVISAPTLLIINIDWYKYSSIDFEHETKLHFKAKRRSFSIFSNALEPLGPFWSVPKQDTTSFCL